MLLVAVEAGAGVAGVMIDIPPGSWHITGVVGVCLLLAVLLYAPELWSLRRRHVRSYRAAVDRREQDREAKIVERLETWGRKPLVRSVDYDPECGYIEALIGPTRIPVAARLRCKAYDWLRIVRR